MRYLVGFMCVLAGLVASPLSVGAQAGEERTSAEPNAEEPVQSTEPTRSRLERWHPEAFVDPSKPKPTSTPEEPGGFSLPFYVDPLTGAPLAVPDGSPAPQMPTAPRTEEQNRRRRIGIGVGVSLAIVVLAVGAGAAISMASIRDSFD